MSELKNYAQLRFINPIFLDILSHNIKNSVLAKLVGADGVMELKLETDPATPIPKNCEDVLTLLFMLFEYDEETELGQAYAANKLDIMSETILRLSQILDGFGEVELILHTTQASAEDPEAEVTRHTEFKLSRTRKTTSSES